MNSCVNWPRQKGLEPLFVMFVIVLIELRKQNSKHRVHCPVSLREPNRLTQQLNSGYSRQGKNRFWVPRKQGLGIFFFRLVVFLIWEGDLVPVIRKNWVRILMSNSYGTFCFPSKICTIYSRLQDKYYGHPEMPCSAVVLADHCILHYFSVSSQFGEGRGSLLKKTVYLLWTILLLQRQLSEVHLSHSKLQTQSNCPVEGFLMKAIEH